MALAVYSSALYILKPMAGNNKARCSNFHRYVGQFLPRDHGGFGDKNQKKSDILGIAQKVRLDEKLSENFLGMRKNLVAFYGSWLHKFANSRFNNQKFVILSIEYECALKNSSNHRVVIRK